MSVIVTSFDYVGSVFVYDVNPTLTNLFIPEVPFQWGSSYFVDSANFNNDLVVPSNWDSSTAQIPTDLFQSGYGYGEDIQLTSFSTHQVNDKVTWIPRLFHGTFYSGVQSYYLYSDESIVDFLGSDEMPDGRSRLNLLSSPKIGVPISVNTLTTDPYLNVIIDSTFQHVSQFSGIVIDGLEQDTSQDLNLDITKQEFILHTNPNNMYINWVIPASLGVGTPIPPNNINVVTFTLPAIPLQDFAVIFTRPDIFQNEVTLAGTYGSLLYGTFDYGNGVQTIGDYMIDWTTGLVTVGVAQNYVDMGYVTFTWDYPAWLEFNANYIVDHGLSITNPTIADIPYLVAGLISDGLPDQEVPFGVFPIIDDSTNFYLDTSHFNLFLFNSTNETFDTGWTRVADLSTSGPNDKHFVLDPFGGTVSFGDNINGAIPEVYSVFYFGLETTIRVEYEPVNSTDYWTDRSTDMYPLHDNLNSGFFYLSREEQVPSDINLTFALTTMTCLDANKLTIQVTDRNNQPISGEIVNLSITGDLGQLEDTTVITDSSGTATTYYIPSSAVEDMAVFVQFFNPGPNSTTVGSPVASTPFSTRIYQNDTITTDIPIYSPPAQVYLYLIYDNEDLYNVYNDQTLTGGQYILYYKTVLGVSSIIRPTGVTGLVLQFPGSLPQPYDPVQPNYQANLRGYAIITQREITVQGTLVYKNQTLSSNLAETLVGYSPIQQGKWTLPILPTTYTSSEISRATWITINPSNAAVVPDPDPSLP